MTNKPLRIGIIALLVLSAACVVAAQSGGDRVVYKDTIVVAAGETRENVIAFGSDVVVEGTVKKTVLAIGGSITVAGRSARRSSGSARGSGCCPRPRSTATWS